MKEAKRGFRPVGFKPIGAAISRRRRTQSISGSNGKRMRKRRSRRQRSSPSRTLQESLVRPGRLMMLRAKGVDRLLSRLSRTRLQQPRGSRSSVHQPLHRRGSLHLHRKLRIKMQRLRPTPRQPRSQLPARTSRATNLLPSACPGSERRGQRRRRRHLCRRRWMGTAFRSQRRGRGGGQWHDRSWTRIVACHRSNSKRRLRRSRHRLLPSTRRDPTRFCSARCRNPLTAEAADESSASRKQRLPQPRSQLRHYLHLHLPATDPTPSSKTKSPSGTTTRRRRGATRRRRRKKTT